MEIRLQGSLLYMVGLLWPTISVLFVAIGLDFYLICALLTVHSMHLQDHQRCLRIQ
jgi:hypothetical protein